MSTVGNRLIWRDCVASEIEINFYIFPVFPTYFSLKFLFRNFGKSIVNHHFHTEMRRLVPRKYMASPQICEFVKKGI